MIYGVATAAYQIEGAGKEDGRTECIWDDFARQPGKVVDNDNGLVACDHYHKYKEDIKIMKDLGVDAYRFSIAWPRIFPKKGEFNQKGMDFYIDLCKELIANGLKPVATLYHWDLPMWAYKEGGWLNREIVNWFSDYARVCFEQLDEYMDSWITHNEPWCASFLSHIIGAHAPGHNSVEEGVIVAHHLLLTHGAAVNVYKKEFGHKNKIGITLNFTDSIAYTDSEEDKLARKYHDGFNNRWFLEPIFSKKYPEYMVELMSEHMESMDFVHEGDFDIIATECDYLGINYYTRAIVKYDDNEMFKFAGAPSDADKTFMEWDIAPESLKSVVDMVREYTDLPIVITENGSCWDDKLEDGKVHDVDRIDYLEKHLKAVDEMNADGKNITGYFAWSLMDNYEWAFGYSKRFGIVYVDYETLERYPKDSYYRYKEIIAENK